MQMLKKFLRWYFTQAAQNYAWVPSGMIPV